MFQCYPLGGKHTQQIVKACVMHAYSGNIRSYVCGKVDTPQARIPPKLLIKEGQSKPTNCAFQKSVFQIFAFFKTLNFQKLALKNQLVSTLKILSFNFAFEAFVLFVGPSAPLVPRYPGTLVPLGLGPLGFSNGPF